MLERTSSLGVGHHVPLGCEKRTMSFTHRGNDGDFREFCAAWHGLVGVTDQPSRLTATCQPTLLVAWSCPSKAGQLCM